MYAHITGKIYVYIWVYKVCKTFINILQKQDNLVPDVLQAQFCSIYILFMDMLNSTYG